MTSRVIVAAFGIAALAACSGCASWRSERPVVVTDPVFALPSVERGAPNKFVDGVGWTLGIPGKVLLWDRRVENHQVSADTEQSIAEYMSINGLGSTKVRINQYAPGDEWRRLVANKKVGAGWRYTFGALRTAGYTVLPGRLVGNDGYNPYTDTASIYSDIPALAIEQGAHAKIVKGASHPGTYASVFSLPILALTPEGKAKRLTLDYLASHGTEEEQIAAVKTLSPQYGSEVGGHLGFILTPAAQPIMTVLGAGSGHLGGKFRTHRMERDAERLALASAESDAVAAPAPPVDVEVAQASSVEPILRR